MQYSIGFCLGLAALAVQACAAPAQSETTLAQARSGHGPDTVISLRQGAKPPKPPAKVLSRVSYPAALGQMAGYLTPDPGDGKKHPAIIWISGGDTSIGDFWTPQPRANDQSAAAFREAGLVVFYPAVRGLNGNPGKIEGFYGELDDLVAATRWLKLQPSVDPERVYLGGHSSGGTMVLLAAEYANEWKAVFSFGPVDDPRGYGAGLWGALPYDPNNDAASRLRAPVHWLPSIAGPVFVIEGDKQGNLSSLQAMRDINRNPQVHFAVGRGCTHFSILRPGSERIAQVIARDAAGSLEGADGLNLVC